MGNLKVSPSVMCSKVGIASLVRQSVRKFPAVLSALTQCQPWKRKRHSAWQLREGLALPDMRELGPWERQPLQTLCLRGLC